MVVQINGGSRTLTFLLFVRAAWGIGVTDLPELDPAPEAGSSQRPEGASEEFLASEWEDAWSAAVSELYAPQLWSQATPSARSQYDAMTFEELLAIGDPRRSGLFSRGIDLQALSEWERASHRPRRVGLDNQPERINLHELLPAWRTGLSTIVQLPLSGDYARRISSTHLLVSAFTRRQRDEYANALTLPVEPITR